MNINAFLVCGFLSVCYKELMGSFLRRSLCHWLANGPKIAAALAGLCWQEDVTAVRAKSRLLSQLSRQTTSARQEDNMYKAKTQFNNMCKAKTQFNNITWRKSVCNEYDT